MVAESNFKVETSVSLQKSADDRDGFVAPNVGTELFLIGIRVVINVIAVGLKY